MTERYKTSSRRVEQIITFSLGTLSATSDEMPVIVAPFDCEILSAHIVDTTGVTANDSNYWTFAMENKGSGGSGSGSICSVTTKTTVSGGTGDIAAFDAQSLGTITNGLLTKGDVASIKATKAASAGNTDNTLLVVRYREI